MSIVLERDEESEEANGPTANDFDAWSGVGQRRDYRQSTAWLELRLRSAAEILVEFNWRNQKETTTLTQVPLHHIVESGLLRDAGRAHERLPDEATETLDAHFRSLKDANFDLFAMDYGRRTGLLPALNWSEMLPRTPGIAFAHQPQHGFAPVTPRRRLRIAACLSSAAVASGQDAFAALRDHARAHDARLTTFYIGSQPHSTDPSTGLGEPPATRPPQSTPRTYPGVRHPQLLAILNQLDQHGADIVWLIGKFSITLDTGTANFPGEGHHSHIGPDELAHFVRALGAWAVILRSIDEDTSGARLLAWQLDPLLRTPSFVFGMRDDPLLKDPLRYLAHADDPSNHRSRAGFYAIPYGYQRLPSWEQRSPDERRLLDEYTLTASHRDELESTEGRRDVRSVQRLFEVELGRMMTMPARRRERHQDMVRDQIKRVRTQIDSSRRRGDEHRER